MIVDIEIYITGDIHTPSLTVKNAKYMGTINHEMFNALTKDCTRFEELKKIDFKKLSVDILNIDLLDKRMLFQKSCGNIFITEPLQHMTVFKNEQYEIICKTSYMILNKKKNP